MTLHLPTTACHWSSDLKAVGRYALCRPNIVNENKAIILPAELRLSGDDVKELYHPDSAYSNETTKVYETQIALDNAESIHAACKVVTGTPKVKELRKEAKSYTGLLNGLQGICVSVFLGLYEGRASAEDEEDVACLLTVLSGKAVGVSAWPLDVVLTERITNAYRSIHYTGSRKNNLDSENVLVDPDGKVFIIDFEKATDHPCPFHHEIRYNETRPYSEPPLRREMEIVCSSYKVRPPPTLRFVACGFPCLSLQMRSWAFS
ncbi:hypothetical protein OBBRIDRAFT_891783 [Obba rivulosa]|uniref:Protein kinase domain-containing protein n=1 Tax=Obba rivulosa TaxID=1052685 RepID=A0A8E2AH97_9APHY|nr:hypothetical protein OBBRIDRAFT_891783 [Obba rivulosa]